MKIVDVISYTWLLCMLLSVLYGIFVILLLLWTALQRG